MNQANPEINATARRDDEDLNFCDGVRCRAWAVFSIVVCGKFMMLCQPCAIDLVSKLSLAIARQNPPPRAQL